MSAFLIWVARNSLSVLVAPRVGSVGPEVAPLGASVLARG
jgi:hypothetical protein